MQRRQFLARLAALSAAGAAPFARAQTYPNQSIRWVVPYPAGGGTDVLARTLAETLRVPLNQPIVVDNRPGGATNIGVDAVARSAPDGYTVVSGDNAALAFNEYLFTKLPYDPKKDFTYIGGIARFPLALVVFPGFPAKDVKEFLAYAAAHPNEVNYASPGNGSPHHLAMELFKHRTGAALTHVPYRGAAPAMTDVMAGQVQCMFLDLAAGLSLMQTGKVKVLAIGSAKRSAMLPDVPTLAEAGVPDVEVFAFQGLLGPAGMPPEIVTRLNSELNRAFDAPAVVKRFADFGMEPLRGSPEDFRKFARAESERWGPVIKATGIKLD
jgi:tripartite-type tricarboxylate transporter receptor subunit TctC